MLKAYKVRLKTNDKMNTQLMQCAGVARYIFNWGLAEMQRRYEAGEKTSPLKLCTEFNAIKHELCPFVTEVPYAIGESAFRNLDSAFQNFFRRLKAGEKPGYPKFKSRARSTPSFQLRDVKVFSGYVYLPRIGNVNLCQEDYIPVGADYGTYATISKRAEHWYISILVDDGLEYPEPVNGDAIGVDVGIKTLATFSDGHTVENPRPLQKSEKKLATLQRELSRRTKGGQNYKKTKEKIAKLHEKVSNQRKHTQHEVSNYAIENGQTIVVESLHVKGMMKNHNLAKAVSDSAMSEVLRQIQYKAKWNGNELIEASQWYPSSKTCSNCGAKKDDLTLADRVFVCPECGFEIDRDLNAAKNLAALANRESHGDCLGS